MMKPVRSNFLIIAIIFLCNIMSIHYTVFSQTLQRPFQRYEYKKIEMAVMIRLVFYGPAGTTGSQRAFEKEKADAAAEKAFERVRQLNLVFSDYTGESEMRKACIAAQSGEPVAVSDDLWIVLAASQKYYRLSQGVFDPTVATAVKLWRRAQREERFPSQERLEEARRLTNYSLVELNEKARTMRFKVKGLRLDFGGIAKGYVIDEALKVLREEGYPSALVDAGGDVGIGDPIPEGQKNNETSEETGQGDLLAPLPDHAKRYVCENGWRIGILDSTGEKVVGYAKLARCGVATSGATNRYVIIDGTRYSHIIDPRTGIGLTNSAVTTVIAPTAMDADAWASARSVNPKLPESAEWLEQK